MDYDVIVVGAGPAGSCLAAALAAGGASVALLDAARFPRPKCCAGWLSARAVEQFRFLDGVRRKVKAAPFRRLVFHSPDLGQTAVYSSRAHLGYVVRRDRFDAELVRRAKAAGADVLLGQAVTRIEPAESQVSVTRSRGRRITGRFLVGADGARSEVARQTGLRDHWPTDALVYCLTRDIPLTRRQVAAGPGTGQAHVCLGFGAAPGYAWVFPGAGYASVGIGVRGQSAAAALADLYEQWVEGLTGAGLLPAGADASRPCGGVVPAGAAIEFENHVGKRSVLVGDAGGFASAVSGEGIYPAIWSAAIAADCIQSALTADRRRIKTDSCQDELQKFRQVWRQDMAQYLQMPNVNVTFLVPLIFTNQEIADRFGRAFLFGENL